MVYSVFFILLQCFHCCFIGRQFYWLLSFMAYECDDDDVAADACGSVEPTIPAAMSAHSVAVC